MRIALLPLAVLAVFCTVPSIASAGPPRPARPGYILADGSVSIVGNDGMGKLILAIGKIVARTRPEMRLTTTMKGSSTGLPALAAGVTPFAPLAREAWRGELAGFRQIHDYEATAVRIGYSGWGPRPTGKTPAAVYVAKSNPLRAISVEDLGRTFVAGRTKGDINLWSQLGLGGTAAGRRVHIYGLRDDGGFATAFRERFFGKYGYAPRYEPLDDYEAVVRAVAADPYGIGIAGWIDAARVSDGVRIVPIGGEGQSPAAPDRETVAAGRYPLSSSLYFYVDKAPGKPIDPLAKAWLEAALSDEGQALIAAESDGEEGYLPLSPADLAAERARLASF